MISSGAEQLSGDLTAMVAVICGQTGGLKI